MAGEHKIYLVKDPSNMQEPFTFYDLETLESHVQEADVDLDVQVVTWKPTHRAKIAKFTLEKIK